MINLGIVLGFKQYQDHNHDIYIKRIREYEIDYYKYLANKYGNGEFIYDEKEYL